MVVIKLHMRGDSHNFDHQTRGSQNTIHKRKIKNQLHQNLKLVKKTGVFFTVVKITLTKCGR